MTPARPDRPVPDIVVPPPGPKSRELIARQDRVLFKGLTACQEPFVMARKWGHVIEDVDGNTYLNLAIASGSMPLGPDYPKVLEPTMEALARFGNEDSMHVCTTPMLTLAESLLEIAPGNITRVAPALNGTEAVEAALKFMRRVTGRPMILSFMGQYHGESTATIGLGAQLADIGRGQRQLNPAFVHVPFPNPYRTPFTLPRPGGSGDATVDFIRDHVLFHLAHPEEIAGVMIEPVVGAGGVLIPPDSFWPALVDLCREHGWLLCADEVKSGMGRTGKMFAVEHWGVEPDLIVLGKALGGGVMPMGAVLGTEQAMGSFDDVTIGSTWSWPPAGCVAAVQAIEVYRSLLPRVLEIEAVARRTIGALPDRYDVVGDVRIIGTYLAIEFVRDQETKDLAPNFQRAFEEEILRRGVIAQGGENTFKMLPPYVIPLDDFEQGMALVEEAIGAALASGALEEDRK
jgi:4-aminobutyrate aminotransferase-like enzyme